jgi:hypothetical protein
MSSTQPLSPPRTSPLRALRQISTQHESLNLVTDPLLSTGTPATSPIYSPRAQQSASAPATDSLVDHANRVRGQTGYLSPLESTPRQTGYLHGVSLSAILQMLHLERKSCVVEVSARGWLGTLTLVNGELVDASTGDYTGEDAACVILNWADPQTAILDGTDLFRHTVQRPITQLIMDAVRIVDETGALNPANLPAFDRPDHTLHSGDWQWLIDSLSLIGAENVQIVSPDSLPGERRHTGLLNDPNADLARGIRTWATLLGPDVTEVVATRSGHTVVLAVLDADRGEFIYAEAAGPETAELVRRSLRSIQRPR